MADQNRLARCRIAVVGWLTRSRWDILVFFGSALGTFLLVVLLWQGPKMWVGGASPQLAPKDRLELEDKARGTLAQIVGGLAILGGLYFAWRRIDVAQEGTDRYFKAHFSARPRVSSRGISTVRPLGSAPTMARPAPSRPW